ncbi:hypothetical protein J6590_031322 [Homalodisca vitripennis]|nr:hypothetical protein J6590_031322 [Homalodisca vitripennis]
MFIEAFIPIQVQGLVPEPQPGHKPATDQWVLPSRPAFRLSLPYDATGTSNPSYRPLPPLAATLTKYSGLGEFSRISELKAPCPTPSPLTEPNGGPPGFSDSKVKCWIQNPAGRPCPQSPAHHVHLDPCFTHAGINQCIYALRWKCTNSTNQGRFSLSVAPTAQSSAQLYPGTHNANQSILTTCSGNPGSPSPSGYE